MFRALFIAGTLLGFWFGSSKQGQQMRKKMDGAVTDLITEGSETLDHAKSELTNLSKDFDKAKGKIFGSASKDGGKQNGNGKRDQPKDGKDAAPASEEQPKSSENNQSDKEQKKKEQPPESDKKESDKQPVETSAKDDAETESSIEGKELDAKKAQELADKLGAKPATPEDENLAAFNPTDDEERKSA